MVLPSPVPSVAAPVRRIAPLDPCTLGRPFHLLDDFLRRLAQQLDRWLAHRFNAHPEAPIHAHSGGIGAFVANSDGGSWRSYRNDIGSLALDVERPLLLTLLARHYRDPRGAQALLQAEETETEQRFAGSLHRQLIEVLSACGLGEGGEFSPRPGVSPQLGQRVVRVEVQTDAGDSVGRIGLALDDAWMAHLFERVVPARGAVAAPPEPAVPLRERLPVRLDVRLARLELSFDRVLRLAPGDVLPIRPASHAEVLVGELCLYHARVAEHGGMRCVTFLQPAEYAMSPLDSDPDADAAFLPNALDDMPADSMPPGTRRDALQLIRRIPVRLTLEVGSTTLPLAEVMALAHGSVVELDRMAGEPLSIKANGATIGRAEVVVAGENYGLKIVAIDDLGPLTP